MPSTFNSPILFTYFDQAELALKPRANLRFQIQPRQVRHIGHINVFRSQGHSSTPPAKHSFPGATRD